MRILIKTTQEDKIKEYELDAITGDFFSITLYTIDGEFINIPVNLIASMLIL